MEDQSTVLGMVHLYCSHQSHSITQAGVSELRLSRIVSNWHFEFFAIGVLRERLA